MVKDAKIRLKKYKEKLAPDIVSSRFSTLKQTSTERMGIAISSFVDLENRVKGLLAGKIDNPFLNFCYLGFAKEIWKLCQSNIGNVLIKKIDGVKLKWYRRGFDPNILDNIISLFGIPINKLLSSQWLLDCDYRKSHTIIGSSAGAVSDYQVRVIVHYGSGVDSGENVYLNGKCKRDFSDIRFTDKDGLTLLNYWIERKVDGDYAIFWVKVPSIPAYPNTTSIYIYYGNPLLTTTSNLINTFLRIINDNAPLVLSLPFDEGQGSIAYDKSGCGNNGTIYGATWVDGKFGKALSFDGVDDYVGVPHSSSLYLDKDFTVLAWITLERTPPTWNGIIDKGWISYSDFWLLSDKGYNRLRWGIGFTDNTGIEKLFPLVNLKEWNFYAFGVEGSSMFMSFNGGAKDYYTFTKTRKIGTLMLTLGCRNFISYFENVKIDEVRIYNRALSQAEISDLYNNYPFEVPDNPETINKTIIRKYISPEPSHGAWGIEEII